MGDVEVAEVVEVTEEEEVAGEVVEGKVEVEDVEVVDGVVAGGVAEEVAKEGVVDVTKVDETKEIVVENDSPEVEVTVLIVGVEDVEVDEKEVLKRSESTQNKRSRYLRSCRTRRRGADGRHGRRAVNSTSVGESQIGMGVRCDTGRGICSRRGSRARRGQRRS